MALKGYVFWKVLSSKKFSIAWRLNRSLAPNVAAPITSCVTFGTLLNLSGPPLLHL